MQIVERSVGDVTVLDLKGRLVLGDGDDLFRDTVNQLVQLGKRKIVLNLDEVTTVEGLSPENAGELHPLQAAFRQSHALQCGFCTPGILMTLVALLRDHPGPSEREIRDTLSGNLCRCTGYQNIVDAVKLACAATLPR